jgi:hypothetical protein
MMLTTSSSPNELLVDATFEHSTNWITTLIFIRNRSKLDSKLQILASVRQTTHQALKT